MHFTGYEQWRESFAMGTELTEGSLCRLLGGRGRGAASRFRWPLFELCWENVW